MPGRMVAAKLPRYWKVEPGPNGQMNVTSPMRRGMVVVVVVALIVAAAFWILIGPQVATTLKTGDVVMGFGLACVMIVLNCVLAAVVWFASSLRAQWRLGRNFLQVRDTTFDESEVTSYVGANLWIVHPDVGEGGGWLLRVQTRARVGDLLWSSRPKGPLALGQFLASTTGWELNLPPELKSQFRLSVRRTGVQGLLDDLPAGLGFHGEVGDDGKLQLIRRSPARPLGIGLMALGGVLCLIGLIWFAGDLQSGTWRTAVGLGSFLLVGIALVFSGMRPALSKEEWRLGQDFVEIREMRVTHTRVVEYTGGNLNLLRLGGKEGEAWHLVCLARGTQGTLMTDITPESPRLFGEFVSECTGWHFEAPPGVR
jgi:hypothetical protein